MPTSDEELAKKRAHVESLRAQIAEADAEAAKLARETQNDHEADGLDREAANLEAELGRKKQEIKALRAQAERSHRQPSEATPEAAPPAVEPEVPEVPVLAPAKPKIRSSAQADTSVEA